MKIDKVHISDIRIGNTILHTDNKIRTVGRKDVKRGFMGITIFGDSYRLGTILVKKIININ